MKILIVLEVNIDIIILKNYLVIFNNGENVDNFCFIILFSYVFVK